MKKQVFWLFLIVAFGLCLPLPAQAAKIRLKRGGTSSGGTATAPRASSSRGVSTKVRFRSDRRGVLINFGSFQNISSVNYTLTYTSNGVSQGAMGTATPATAGQQREVLFGTCSGGVCRYHSNITNARLIIETKLNSGVRVRKPYRLKV